MRALKRRSYQLADFFREMKSLTALWIPDLLGKRDKPEIPVIVGMTTYPPRIGSAWIAIETLLRQTVKPHKLLLVLNLEEFPDKKIPRRIQAQTRRGLEILWVEKNGRSYDKLLPVRQKYPAKSIVTFDDDKYFPNDLLSDLFQASIENPGCIIGSRGWVIRIRDGEIRYGVDWTRASAGAKGRAIFAPGGNGCLYPADSFDPAFEDLNLALKMCPTADDIWFWFAAHHAGASTYCLGLKPHRQVRFQRRTPALSSVNISANDIQFQKMKERFGFDQLAIRASQ